MVHKLIRKPGALWDGDPTDKKTKDSSEEKGVLYFVFKDAKFDIDTFGPTKQRQMAQAIHQAAMERFANFARCD